MKTGRSQWTPSSPTGRFSSSFQSSLKFSLCVFCIKDKSPDPRRPIFLQTALPASRSSSAAWCLCQVRSSQPTSKFKSVWRSWPGKIYSLALLVLSSPLSFALQGRSLTTCRQLFVEVNFSQSMPSIRWDWAFSNSQSAESWTLKSWCMEHDDVKQFPAAWAWRKGTGDWKVGAGEKYKFKFTKMMCFNRIQSIVI